MSEEIKQSQEETKNMQTEYKKPEEQLINPDEILTKALIDPEKVDSTKYSDAINMGKNQIKEALKIIESIKAERKDKISKEATYYKTEMDKLSNIQKAIEKATQATKTRADEVNKFNNAIKSKEEDANKSISNKNQSLNAAKTEKSAAEIKIQDCKATISSKLGALEASKIPALKKKKAGDENEKLMTCINKFLDPSTQIIDTDYKKGEAFLTKIRTLDASSLKKDAISSEQATIDSLKAMTDATAISIVEALAAAMDQASLQASIPELEAKQNRAQHEVDEQNAIINSVKGQKIEGMHIDTSKMANIEAAINEKVNEATKRYNDANDKLQNFDATFEKECPVINIDAELQQITDKIQEAAQQKTQEDSKKPQ